MSRSEEKTPLFAKNDFQIDDSNSGNSSSGSSTSFRIPIYGAANPHETIIKPIPIDERITYTWNSVNVFTNTDQQPQSFSSLCFCFKKGERGIVPRKHLVKNVSGAAYPGELLAILGSSGAGKTTLLNALTFRSPKSVNVTGMRCVNGNPVNSKALTSQSAYVQQQELFIGSLTVKEHLIFQALLRMDKDISYEQRMQRVEEVLSEMSLNKCSNTCIGIPGRLKGISGGEQKRLSFAAEVLTNPSLMFCDEPTSGLDSFMALNTVHTLKNMAQAGKTVICTIHQPSSELYAMFDKLLLMAEGRIAFLGTPEEADVFFRQLEAPCPKNYNPADYFIQLLAIAPGNEEPCRQAINMICDKFERSEFGVKIALESASKSGDFLKHDDSDLWLNGGSVNKSPYKASWLAQFRAVLWRSWLSVIKEPLLVKVRFIQTVLISLVVSAIFYGQKIDADGVMNINGALFIFLTTVTFQNVFAVVTIFTSEQAVFFREHGNGMYRTDVYFLGKTFADLPVFVAIPLLFVSICYFLIGLNNEMPRYFVTCAILILVTNVATSFGYFISSVSSTVQMALSLGPPLTIPFLLFGGFFLNVKLTENRYHAWLDALGIDQRIKKYSYFSRICSIHFNTSDIIITPRGKMTLRHGALPALNLGPNVEHRRHLLLQRRTQPELSIPIYFEWLSYLSWFKYGNEALMINQWEGVTDIQCPAFNSSCPKNGHIVLQMYNFREENLIPDIVSLFGLIVAFRLAAFLVLLWKSYKHAE